MSLEEKTQVQPAERVYEDFEPPYDWVHDEASDTLILSLPEFRKEQLSVQIASNPTLHLTEFRKEQLSVQIASNRILKLSGERHIRDNKWQQFRKEFPIPSESDTSGVSAKFENGMLYVKLPKLITPIQPQPPTQQEAPKPTQLPTPQPPLNVQTPRTLEAKTEKTTKPPPAPIAPHQESNVDEDSQKKPKQVDKAAEAYKAEKTEAAAAAAPTPVTPLHEPKKEVDDSQKKLPQKEKGKSEATTSKAQGVHEAKVDKRSQTLEVISRQTQEYKNAVSGLMEELKKQKKLANLLVVIFLVLLFGLFVKNAIKSSFGGPKIEEL